MPYDKNNLTVDNLTFSFSPILSVFDVNSLVIVDYKVLNDKVVICTFADGETEKAVCHEEDTFDFNKAIEVCLMKHLSRMFTGKECYNDLLKNALKDIKKVDKKKAEVAEVERIKLNHKLKNARRKERKRQKKIDDMAEAYVRAMYRINNDDMR